MTDLIPQLVGYSASALVVWSLTMKSILRLRLIGLIGSTTFLVYGILIEAVPIVITNGVILGIHAFFLRRLLGKTEIFSLLKVRADSDYLRAFLEFHATEIQRFQPGYLFGSGPDLRIWFILRDMLPAGLFIAEPQLDGSFEIVLDYAIPQYRDLKLGTWVYSGRSGMFAEDHPGTVWAKHWSDDHDRYLERMGFAPAERGGEPVFVLRIA
jgi:hypothetical protein